jgi:hypothetical protein
MSSPFLDTVRQKARGVMDRMAAPGLIPAPATAHPAPPPTHNGYGGHTNGHTATRFLDYNQVRSIEAAIDASIPMLENLREFVDYRDRHEIDAVLARLTTWSKRIPLILDGR